MRPTAKIFPIDFPIDLNMSSSTKLYQNVHKLLQNRVRPLFVGAQSYYMNTHANEIQSKTVSIGERLSSSLHGLINWGHLENWTPERPEELLKGLTNTINQMRGAHMPTQ